MILVAITSFFLIVLIDRRINVILKQYINIEVERLTNNIVSDVVGQVIVDSKYSDYLTISRNRDGTIENISYNTHNINVLTNKVSEIVQEKLFLLEDGDLKDFYLPDKFKRGQFKHIKNGILCEISLGSIRGSTLFANVGPNVPIRLTFIGQVNTEIDLHVQEYGINNVLIEIDIIVKVRELASMPLTSEEKEIEIRQPLSIDIIKGEIPSYYNGVLS